jgi:tRNA (cytidine56-2'-O)-methyltransferase
MTGKNVQEVIVLRLGHRPSRDKRVSTHLFLAARTFGANKAYYTGIQDDSLEKSIRKIVLDWGGDFSLEHVDGLKKVLNRWHGKVVHLTMYGIPYKEVIEKIRSDPAPKLIIVGGAKVPLEAYRAADWNVAISGQPHSEVSALAIFLHELYEGFELGLDFPGAHLSVIPQEKGKKIKMRNKRIQT